MNQDLHSSTPRHFLSHCRVVPVIDYRGGIALHARAGSRDDYLPVRGIMGQGEDPFGIAEAFKNSLGLSTLYLADLDAIAGRPFDPALLQSLAGAGFHCWIDAGIKTADERRRLEDAGASAVIVATETLAGPRALEKIVQAGRCEPLIFSLDLREGRPIVAKRSSWSSAEPLELVHKAWNLGLSRFLLLETARMGRGGGFGNHDLIAEILGRFPEASLAVGGGVSSKAELIELRHRGVFDVLVGSALHDGRITRLDLDLDLDLMAARESSLNTLH